MDRVAEALCLVSFFRNKHSTEGSQPILYYTILQQHPIKTADGVAQGISKILLPAEEAHDIPDHSLRTRARISLSLLRFVSCSPVRSIAVSAVYFLILVSVEIPEVQIGTACQSVRG